MFTFHSVFRWMKTFNQSMTFHAHVDWRAHLIFENFLSDSVTSWLQPLFSAFWTDGWCFYGCLRTCFVAHRFIKSAEGSKIRPRSRWTFRRMPSWYLPKCFSNCWRFCSVTQFADISALLQAYFIRHYKTRAFRHFFHWWSAKLVHDTEKSQSLGFRANESITMHRIIV